METLSNKNLYNLLKDQIVSFDKYSSGDLKVIGLPNYKISDAVVKDSFSYIKWIEQYYQHPVIKVEGIETFKQIAEKFSIYRPIDIHLFVSQKTSYSFNWHTDSTVLSIQHS